MYHEQSYQSKRRGRQKAIALVGVLVVAAIVAVFAFGHVMRQAHEQGAATLRQTILNAAYQCSAIEGAYPASLSHLERVYGLSINHSDYAVTYEAYAGNVVPTVVVIPR